MKGIKLQDYVYYIALKIGMMYVLMYLYRFKLKLYVISFKDYKLNLKNPIY